MVFIQQELLYAIMAPVMNTRLVENNDHQAIYKGVSIEAFKGSNWTIYRFEWEIMPLDHILHIFTVFTIYIYFTVYFKLLSNAYESKHWRS